MLKDGLKGRATQLIATKFKLARIKKVSSIGRGWLAILGLCFSLCSLSGQPKAKKVQFEA